MLLGLTGFTFSGRLLTLWKSEDTGTAQSILNTNAAAFLVGSVALTLLIGDTVAQPEKPEADAWIWLGMFIWMVPHFVMSTLQTAWWQGSLANFLLMLPLTTCLHLEYTPPAVVVACWLGNSAAMYHAEYTTRCAFLHGIAFTTAAQVEGPGCSTELIKGHGTGNGAFVWVAENSFLDPSPVQDISSTTHQQVVTIQTLTELHQNVSKLWDQLGNMSPLSTSVSDVVEENSWVNQEEATAAQVLEESKQTVSVLLKQLANLSSLHSTSVSPCASPDQDSSFSFDPSSCTDFPHTVSAEYRQAVLPHTSNSSSDQCNSEFISPPHEVGFSHNKRKALPLESPVEVLFDFTGLISHDAPTTSWELSHAQLCANRNSKINAVPANWTIMYEEAAKDTWAVSVAADAAKCALPSKPSDTVKVGSHCSDISLEVQPECQDSNEVVNPAKRVKAKFQAPKLTIPEAPNVKVSMPRTNLIPRAKFRGGDLIFEEHGTAGKKTSRTIKRH